MALFYFLKGTGLETFMPHYVKKQQTNKGSHLKQASILT